MNSFRILIAMAAFAGVNNIDFGPIEPKTFLASIGRDRAQVEEFLQIVLKHSKNETLEGPADDTSILCYVKEGTTLLTVELIPYENNPSLYALCIKPHKTGERTFMS